MTALLFAQEFHPLEEIGLTLAQGEGIGKMKMEHHAGPIRVLSLWQPWAAAMATYQPGTNLPIKANETRNWRPHIGPFWLAIHAAKKKYRPSDYDPQFVKRVRDFKLDNCWMVYGAILCLVYVVDFPEVQSLSYPLTDLERTFGNYVNANDDGEFEQRYAWRTDPNKLKVLKNPVYMRGEQKLFTWDVPTGLEFKEPPTLSASSTVPGLPVSASS